ncbi:MAG: 30S ribosomal protein S7 [Nanoarchaeota archaeon]
MAEIKLYDKWSFSGVVVEDAGLASYINLKPILVPRTNGYYHNTPFYKTKVNIVERLLNRLQVTGHKGRKHKQSSGHNTGKALTIANQFKEVLEIIEKRTKENPIQVLVTAIENASPREEVITIERSGARYAQAVDMSPQRRVDLAIRHMALGPAQKAFDGEITLVNALVDEITSAYSKEDKSFAVSRRMEIEKMAAAAK